MNLLRSLIFEKTGGKNECGFEFDINNVEIAKADFQNNPPTILTTPEGSICGALDLWLRGVVS